MSMLSKLKYLVHQLLRWSEKYTKTDMVYFASSNFWINAGRVVSLGSGILLTVAFANLLTPEQFGTYKYVIAAAGFVGVFSLNGLATSVMRAVAQGKFNVIPAVFRTATLWTIPASFASLGVSAYYFIQGNNELGFAFLFIGATNSISSGIGSTKNVWGAARQFKLQTIVGLPKIFVPFLIILFTIIITKNITWILFAYFFSNILLSVLGYYFMLWWFSVKDSPKGVDETIRYGKQMTALGFFQIAGGQIDQLLLWHFTTPATLAIYALAIAPVNEAKSLLHNFSGIMFAKIANKTETQVHQTLPLRILQLTVVSIALTILYVAVVPFLFQYIFPKYMESVFVSQILAITILFQVSTVVDTYFIAHGEIKKRTGVILTAQAIRFALICILIPFFGLWGAVAAIILSELSNAIIFLYIYFKTARDHRAKMEHAPK